MITHEGWPWQPDKCPADMHFISMCTNDPIHPIPILDVTGKRVLQMGPGLHHQVAISLPSTDIVSVTNSPEEYESYVTMLYDSPMRSQYYVCLFSDIYSMPLDVLGTFDVVYLPHIGEIAPQEYHVRDDRKLLLKARAHCTSYRSQGRIVTYNQSSAYDRMLPVIRDIGLHKDFTYKSMDVWF